MKPVSRLAYWTLAALPLLDLSGCASVQQVAASLPPPSSPPVDVQQLRAEACSLQRQGRYQEAIDRLNAALQQRPGDTRLIGQLERAERVWHRLKISIRNQLAVVETRALMARLPLLDRMARADPQDAALREQLARARAELTQRHADLGACGRHQAKADRRLARACLRLSLALGDNSLERKLLRSLRRTGSHVVGARPATRHGAGHHPVAPVTPPLYAEADATTPGSSVPPPPKGPDSSMPPPEGHKGKGDLEAGPADLRVAKKSTPGAASIAMAANSGSLREQTSADKRANSGPVMTVGDVLYQNGKVREALALWQWVLRVDPENASAEQKSERARRVLANIRALDKGQAKAPADPSGK